MKKGRNREMVEKKPPCKAYKDVVLAIDTEKVGQTLLVGDDGLLKRLASRARGKVESLAPAVPAHHRVSEGSTGKKGEERRYFYERKRKAHS